MGLLGDLRLDVADSDTTSISNNLVGGPNTSTDNGVARFDGTDGSQIQGSLATLDDSGNLSTPGSITAGTLLQTNGALVVNSRLITSAGNVSISSTDTIIMLNKTVGQITTVTLPASQSTGRVIIIKDVKGDASINNITVVPSGGETIDGLSGFLLTQNYQSVTFIYNSSGWSIV